MSAIAITVFFIYQFYGFGKIRRRGYFCLLDVISIGHSRLKRGRVEVVVLHDTLQSIVVNFLDIFRDVYTELLGVGNSDLNLVPVGSELLRFFLGVNVFGVCEVTNCFFHGLTDGTFLRIRCREATEIITGRESESRKAGQH